MSSEKYEYYDLANATGWFIIAAIVFSGFYTPSAEDVVKVAAGLGVVNLIKQFA